MNGQTKRILNLLLEAKGREVPAVDLHRAGSPNETGFCASLSRRISDVREMGYTVDCRKEQHGNQIHTFYTLTERLPHDMPDLQMVAQSAM